LPAPAATAAAGELPRAPERAIPERPISASAVIRDRVVATVEEQPEVAARLLRSWMKE
jgi:flagellar biosynthesis/type III secretory pathway M-ring protein FliF/YscJ